MTVRALIDVCSQASYISEKTIQTLKIKKLNTDVEFFGITGSKNGASKQFAILKIKIAEDEFMHVKAIIVKNITKNQNASKSIPAAIKREFALADDWIDKIQQVDMLIGANYGAKLFLSFSTTRNNLLLQQTKLGFIVSGSARNSFRSKQSPNNSKQTRLPSS